MSTFQGPGLSPNATLDDVINYVIRLERKLKEVLNNIDSDNLFEVGGWRVRPDSIQSKDGDVGMSTADDGPDPIRFWAGDAINGNPPFKVTHNGYMYSTRGFIGGWDIGPDKLSGAGILEGGTVRSGPPNSARIELSGGKFSGYTASGQRSGIYFDINAVPGTGLADVGLYHLGSQLMVFFDNIDHYTIKPGSGAISMALGENGKIVNALGTWNFSSGVSGTVYVSTTPGGPADTPIDFTNGLRTG